MVYQIERVEAMRASMPFIRPAALGPGTVCAILIAQFAFLRAAEPAPIETKKPWLPEIKVETYTLPNGLTVTLHQDHKVPLVAVHVTYNVGSKDDPPGRGGLAHLFEHLMFEGSEHSNSSFYSPIYQYMADAQGSTGRDRTDYYETVTSNALERTLWLEADRMGFLLPAVTKAKLSKARAVVTNERWQTVDGPPLGQVAETYSRALYPPGHPYRHLIIGSLADLSAARYTDITAFFERHYAPNNAFLCVAGDFELGQAMRWIKKYFGRLQPGPPAAPVRQQVPALTAPRRITLKDRVSHAQVGMIWPTVPANHPDEAALDVLASILGGESRWNRLFRALTYDRQIASYASAYHPTYLLAGTFDVYLVARFGENLDEMIRLADAEIERLKSDGPTVDEVRKVKIERRRRRIMDLDSVSGKASVLNDHAATHGDPLAYRSVLGKVFAVTPDDVRRVARAYLGPCRIEYLVYPGERASPPRKPDPLVRGADQPATVRPAPLDDTFDRSVVPEAGPPSEFVPPLIKRRRLSNGLELRIVERHELPIVRLKLVFKSGEASAPRGKDGLSLMTVNLLEEGTRSRSALQLEADLNEIGAALSSEGLMESSTISLTTATPHLERALDLCADVVLNPLFSDGEYLRLKLRWLARLKDRADNAEQIAEDVLPRLLYHPDHPYARARLGTLESVTAITREDIVEFYGRHYVPGNASVVVVGDVRSESIAAALEARFGRWPAAAIPPSPGLPATPWPAGAPAIYLIDKPGAAQSVVTVGRIAASIRSPDRRAFMILTEELKGRVNSNLLDDKASTYGFSATIDFRNDLGPFVLTGSVPTLKTTKTFVEIFKEMDDLAGPTPVTEQDLTTIRQGMGPERIDSFERITDVAAQVAYTVVHHLPDDHFATEPAGFMAVTKPDVDWLATHFLAPRWMTVLVVGDRSRIEKSLRALPSGKTIHPLDRHGKPVPKSGTSSLAPVEATGKASKP
jgi:zinc protease